MKDNCYFKNKDITLVEVLDRILDRGVIIAGDLTISVADVDLVYLGLKVLLSSVETMERMRQQSFNKSWVEAKS